jgi:hypothetical protein
LVGICVTGLHARKVCRIHFAMVTSGARPVKDVFSKHYKVLHTLPDPSSDIEQTDIHF